ncbi:hypothetical protein [Chelatococcus reniformis]|nr:hypothetical protein [Chelatococcus reniformis]
MSRNDQGLAAAFLAVTVGVAVALAIMNDITAPICAMKKMQDAAGDKAPVFGCLEFWLNRYQAAIGGGLALLAAFIGGRYALMAAERSAEPGRQQLALSRQQIAASALPELRNELDLIADEGRSFSSLRQCIEKLRHLAEDEQVSVDQSNVIGVYARFSQTCGTMVGACMNIEALVDKSPWGPMQDKSRLNLARKYIALAKKIELQLDSIASNRSYAKAWDGEFEQLRLEGIKENILRSFERFAPDIAEADNIRDLRRTAIMRNIESIILQVGTAHANK